MKYNPIKLFWIALGSLCLAIGTVGIVIPILPSFPFYLATAICYGKSSRRLHSWFAGTILYKRYLEPYRNKKV